MKKENISKLLKLFILAAAILIISSFFTFPVYGEDTGKGFLKFVSVIKGSGGPNFLKGANDVFVSGTKAYIAATQDNAMTIIDISDPQTPVFEGSISGSKDPNYLGGISKLFVEGSYCYAVSYDDCLLYTSDAADDLTRVDLGG